MTATTATETGQITTETEIGPTTIATGRTLATATAITIDLVILQLLGRLLQHHLLLLLRYHVRPRLLPRRLRHPPQT